MFVISSGSLPPFMLTAFGRPWPAVCALIPPPRVVFGDSDELCRAHTAVSSSLQASAVCQEPAELWRGREEFQALWNIL